MNKKTDSFEKIANYKKKKEKKIVVIANIIVAISIGVFLITGSIFSIIYIVSCVVALFN